ncbi:hypothetical protein VTN96DRAFT_7173 [Rasamsonia emersonii]
MASEQAKPRTPKRPISSHEVEDSAEGKFPRLDPEISSRKVGQFNWRECRDFTEFVKAAKMHQVHASSKKIEFEDSGCALPQFILKQATKYLRDVQVELMEKGYTGIEWMNLPPSGPTEPTQHDQVVSIYFECLEIFPFVRELDLEKYYEALQRWFPLRSPPSQGFVNADVVIDAFHRDPKPGRDITSTIYQQIYNYYSDFDSAIHLAPYTSIVGPSGIGKSFVVEQIAREHRTYVVYASLAKSGSDTYPRRSPIADSISLITRRPEMTMFF